MREVFALYFSYMKAAIVGGILATLFFMFLAIKQRFIGGGILEALAWVAFTVFFIVIFFILITVAKSIQLAPRVNRFVRDFNDDDSFPPTIPAQ